jgi:hypothetical protein
LLRAWQPGSLAEKIVQLPGSDGRDQCIDHRRQLVLGPDDDARLALLEFDGLGSELDGHHDLSRRVGLPPGPNGLLLGDGLPLASHLAPPLCGPDVAGILQELLLLLQFGGEFDPTLLDRIFGGLGKRSE